MLLIITPQKLIICPHNLIILPHGMVELENLWKLSGRRVVINLPVHGGATGREDTWSSSSCQPSYPPSRNLRKQESLFRTIECKFCTDSPHTIVSPSLLDTYGKDLSPQFADLKKVNSSIVKGLFAVPLKQSPDLSREDMQRWS